MKKLLLLLAAGCFGYAANAQNGAVTMGKEQAGPAINNNEIKNFKKHRLSDYKAKTTAAPRWYSYVDWFDTSEVDLSSSIALSAPYLWRDTMGVFAYTATGGGTEYNHNRSVSMGLAIDPTFSGFNDPTYYDGRMQISATDAYSVDSILLFGRYGFKPTNTYVDTVRVTFVYGDRSSGADIYEAFTVNTTVLARYGLSASDTMYTYRMRYDTAGVTAAGTTRVVRDILLDNTGASPAWADTLTNGTFPILVGIPDVNVPAGNMIGATISFLSGSPTFTDHDTVFSSTIGYKHNMFRPYVAYRGTASTPNYATYSDDNRNSGMFKTLPDTSLGWGGQFIPLWFWSSTGGAASSLQYPYIDFHIKCATCPTITSSVNDISSIKSIETYPNPASNELFVPFALNNATNTTITLTNMLGQVVAYQQFNNISRGKATFKTSTLPDGIYTVTVLAAGQRQTARVAIAH